MKATIYFLYTSPEGWCSRPTTLENAENDIAYWLGKSPGMYQVEDILVVPEAEDKSWLWVLENKREKEMTREQEIRNQNERAEYERLKVKYEGHY